MTPAFVVVFALFVVALAALAFISVRWGVRRDRAARQAAAQRREQAGRPEEGGRPEEAAQREGGGRAGPGAGDAGPRGRHR